MAADRRKKLLLLGRMVGQSLVRRRSRLVGAVAALAVGSALLAGLVAVSLEIPLQMGREFRAYGANLLVAPQGEALSLTDGELTGALGRLAGAEIVGVSPELVETVTLNRQSVTIVGLDFPQARKVTPYWQISGAWPTEAIGILVGAEVAHQLGLSVGQSIQVSRPHAKTGTWVRIDGILRTGQDEEANLYADRRLVERLFDLPGSLHLARVSLVADPAQLEAWAAELSAPGSPVSAQAVKQLSRSEDHVLGLLSTLLVLVTSVIVVLTFICVATTMTAMVLERRTEIGLKKALGAKNKTIAAEFLGEALALGLAGGLGGMVLGWGLATLIGWNVFGRALAPGPGALASALGLSLVVAAGAGLWPLRSATRLEPAVVLRGE